jgi:hypothetical protein
VIAGDIIVNPKKVLIHRKDDLYCRVKERHGHLSDQLDESGMRKNHILLLLKHGVTIEVAEPTILPHLFEQMQNSQEITSWFLNDAQERMKRIADTINFLSAWSVTSFENFRRRLQTAATKTHAFVCGHMCRFDTRFFE